MELHIPIPLSSKVVTITGNGETLGKYENNREFHIPASQIKTRI